ncbi:hypothetical protein [uncultured Sphingomonas sp.]|uniref:hypothetical protein n=1 Tax=uncultured Sphingomonas sp. TaxID=158754 RepID=UPI0025F66C44|nr:hypothetical protein [uncultured Sphingomonas sp.]
MLDRAIADYTLIAISDMRAAYLAISARLLNAAVMKTARSIVCLATLLLLPATPVLAQEVTTPAAAFDAAKGWASFVQLLQQNYGYFDRPGIDGDAILAAFADRAKATRTDKDFLIGEVRVGGDAALKGMRPGMSVVRVDGVSPRAAIEAITGRPFANLSPVQIGFAFNVALAGHRNQGRTIELRDGHRTHSYASAATNDLALRVEDGPLLDVERRGRTGIIRINNSLGNQQLIDAFAKALASLADTDILLIDLRNTPSGGNTSVARGIMGHFVDHDRPYQMHVIPYEGRMLGPTRKFMEYVAPFGTRYVGKLYVAGGRWTGSMGEGMMIGFDAIGATTVGSDLADLLGAWSNETIEGSAAKVDIGTEQLFTVTGLPREAYRPQVYLPQAERTSEGDPVLDAMAR